MCPVLGPNRAVSSGHRITMARVILSCGSLGSFFLKFYRQAGKEAWVSRQAHFFYRQSWLAYISVIGNVRAMG